MPSLYRGRYAPSPTGHLHLGNARTALVAYWQARVHGGSFVMRIEDLDRARSKPDMIQANLNELRWLGLDWDEGPDVGGPHQPYLQSERQQLYEGALERLIDQNQLFECYLSRKDLREVASAPHGQMPPYGERERSLNEQVKAQKISAGKSPSLRFRRTKLELVFSDLLQGQQCFETGDFIVKRADGEWAYQLAVVVDDIAMKINEVVRGDDLLPSTAAQLLLYQALGAEPPRYLHLPLLLDETGERMAKRKGSLTLTALKKAGVRSERVVGLLAFSLGLAEQAHEMTPREGLSLYRHSHLRKEAFRLEPDHLSWLLER